MPQYRGFNEKFWECPASTYQRVAQAHGNIVRFPFVREWPLSYWNYLWNNAWTYGLKVLPVMLQGSTFGGFPTTDAARTDFANWVVSTIQYFDHGAAYNIIDAVEVWNEPNINGVSANDFVALCQSVATTVNGTTFSTPKKVVSGGIAAAASGWDTYFQTVAGGSNAYCRYDLGIHPYYTDNPSYGCATPPRPTGATQYKNVVVASAVSKFDLASTYMQQSAASSGVTNDIWVTEVGATSQNVWGQAGQDQALQQVAANLRNRPYCRSMIVHRLYPDDSLGGERPPSQSYPCHQTGEVLFKCSVYEPDRNTPKAAYSGLQQRWSSWS